MQCSFSGTYIKQCKENTWSRGAPKIFLTFPMNFLPNFSVNRHPTCHVFKFSIWDPVLAQGGLKGPEIESLKIWQVGCLFTEKFGKKFNGNVKKIFDMPLLPVSTYH